jgi:hypothetical protein
VLDRIRLALVNSHEKTISLIAENPKPRRWFRFGLRTMLVLVTVVCISLSGWIWTKNLVESRGREFDLLEGLHWAAKKRSSPFWLPDNTPNEDVHRYEKYVKEYRAYHSELHEKYSNASRYPWLPVEPDGPEPQPPAT